MALTITGSLTVSGSLKTGISNVDDSIVFAIDPSNPRSYERGSTHIYDLVRHRKNSSPIDTVTGSLNNGLSFVADTGSIVALNFDGTDDHLTFLTEPNTAGGYTFPLLSSKGTRGGLPGDSVGWTIVTHMKWTTSGGGSWYPIYHIRDGKSGDFPRGYIRLSINWSSGGTKIFQYGGAGPYGAAFTSEYAWEAAGTFEPYRWHDVTLVAQTISGTGYHTLFIDGVQVDQYSNTNGNYRPWDLSGGVSFDVGDIPAFSFTQPLKFQLGGLYIHDKPFSAAEVKQNFDAYNGRFNFNT